MTTLGYNLTTPAGRAINHILEKSVLAGQLGTGITVEHHGPSGRMLTVHESFTDVVGDGEATLLCVIESLACQSPVILGHVFGTLDDDNRKATVEALWLAAGYEYLGVTS